MSNLPPVGCGETGIGLCDLALVCPQLLGGASAEQRENLGVTTPDYYYYLNQSGTYTVDDVSDKKDFSDTMVCVRVRRPVRPWTRLLTCLSLREPCQLWVFLWKIKTRFFSLLLESFTWGTSASERRTTTLWWRARTVRTTQNRTSPWVQIRTCPLS